MMNTDPALHALGDELEAAAARDLVARHRRPRKDMIAGAIGAFAVVGASAAAATGVFDSDDVEQGMPNGATIFQGTSPQCTEVEADVVYRCLVPGGPQPITPSVSYQQVQCPEDADGAESRCIATGSAQDGGEPAVDYEGVIEVLSSADLVVSGGCVGQDRAGTEWLCYVGQRAVDEGLIAQDFLGMQQPAPGGVG
jgi:hypothetical protein